MKSGSAFEVDRDFLISMASTSALEPNQLYVSCVTETAFLIIDIWWATLFTQTELMLVVRMRGDFCPHNHTL